MLVRHVRIRAQKINLWVSAMRVCVFSSASRANCTSSAENGAIVAPRNRAPLFFEAASFADVCISNRSISFGKFGSTLNLIFIPTFLRTRQVSASYLFGPIRIWITGVTLCVLNGTSFASIPILLSPEISASVAGNKSLLNCGSTLPRYISTFSALTEPEIGRSVRWITCAASPTLLTIHDTCVQPAAVSAASRSQTKFACSPSPIPRPVSNFVPENRLSDSTSGLMLGERMFLRGALNLASSNCASAIFWFASAARAFASAMPARDASVSAVNLASLSSLAASIGRSSERDRYSPANSATTPMATSETAISCPNRTHANQYVAASASTGSPYLILTAGLLALWISLRLWIRRG
jgi:hypothetical protein